MIILPQDMGGPTTGVRATFTDNQPGYGTKVEGLVFYDPSGNILGSIDDGQTDDVLYLAEGTIIKYVRITMSCFPNELFRPYDYKSCVNWDLVVTRSTGTTHYDGGYSSINDFQVVETGWWVYTVQTPNIDLTVESGYTHDIVLYFKICVNS